jgi:hypothetical protein
LIIGFGARRHHDPGPKQDEQGAQAHVHQYRRERGACALTDEQTGAPAFGYPAKDQRELAAECRRLTSMLVLDNIHYRKLVPTYMSLQRGY